MPYITLTLDANAFVTLEGDDYDRDLNEVLRRGLDGYYTVAVTSELKAELSRDTDLGRRERNLQKLEKFPEAQMPDEISIAALSKEVMTELFPSASPTTGAYARQCSDCRHLAIHLLTGRDYFITADQELLRRLPRLSPKNQVRAGTAAEFLRDVFYPTIQPERAALVLPQLSIQLAKERDKPAILSLVGRLDADYPGFSGWLDDQFRSPDVIIKLAIANKDTVAGISIGKPKGSGVWKLATFYVDPAYQGNGLGQHLLFHEVQSWLEAGISKVVVTTPLDKRELIGFFERVGFVVEGVAPERYPGRTEVVLGRHFVRGTFTPDTFKDLARVLAERLFVANVRSVVGSEALCASALRDLPLYASRPADEFVLRCRMPSAQEFAVDVVENGDVRKSLSILDLETMLHPLTLTWPQRVAFIVPIYERYANQLFEMARPQLSLFQEPATRRLLQMDNVYYCYPRYSDTMVAGTPLLFYVTKRPDSGSGVAGKMVGMALVEEIQVAPPDVLYLRHGQRGVYDIEAITNHANNQGNAMAIHFSWLRPFARLVAYRDVRKMVPQWNHQTLHAITHGDFLSLCARGELSLGSAAGPPVRP